MHEGFAAFLATGAGLGQPMVRAMLAEVYRKMGRAAEGLRELSEAFSAMQRNGEYVYEPWLHWLKGELVLQSSVQSPDSRAQEAHKSFRQAINMARRRGAKSWELRAATSLSRLWYRQGKPAKARKLLSEVYGWFTEGFETPDLKSAKVLLEEMA